MFPMQRKIALSGEERIAWCKTRNKAAAAVRRAVKSGELKNLKKSKVKCTDCDSRAEVYDHRDYNKPLLVEPVCIKCNIARGTNAPKLPEANRPRCPMCGSGIVLFVKTKGMSWCRKCGHEWRKP